MAALFGSVIKKRSKNSGATMIEFGIACIVLLLFVLGIIDFARVMYTQAALTFSLEEALHRATVQTDFDITIRPNTDPLLVARFNNARSQVKAAFNRFKNLFLSDFNQPSPAQLEQYQIRYNHPSYGTPPFVSESFFVQRPLEVVRLNRSGVPTDIPYPTINEPINAFAPMAQLMKRYPIVVGGSARIQLLLPCFSPYTINTVVQGYRETGSGISSVLVPPLPVISVGDPGDPSSGPPGPGPTNCTPAQFSLCWQLNPRQCPDFSNSCICGNCNSGN